MTASPYWFDRAQENLAIEEGLSLDEFKERFGCDPMMIMTTEDFARCLEHEAFVEANREANDAMLEYELSRWKCTAWPVERCKATRTA